jgi:hypothetical protein
LQQIWLSRLLSHSIQLVRIKSRQRPDRERSKPEHCGVLLFNKRDWNALHPFAHGALVFEDLAESGVVSDVGKAFRDAAEKKHAIPRGDGQSEIAEDITGNLRKKV